MREGGWGEGGGKQSTIDYGSKVFYIIQAVGRNANPVQQMLYDERERISLLSPSH